MSSPTSIGASWAVLMPGLVVLGIGSGVANAALGRLAVVGLLVGMAIDGRLDVTSLLGRGRDR